MTIANIIRLLLVSTTKSSLLLVCSKLDRAFNIMFNIIISIWCSVGYVHVFADNCS